MTEGAVHIGIDPGKKGAIAILGDGIPKVFDMPYKTEYVIIKKRKVAELVFDASAVIDILLPYCFHRSMHITLEKIQHQGKAEKMGTRALDTFLKEYGELKGALKSHNLPFIEVAPITWENFIDKPEEKAGSIKLAQWLYPEIKQLLYGPRGGIKDGRADALLIAYYGQIRHS